MPKLFVFGIGGTGARVLKSLTMLLASGIKTGAYDVVPILIDPHETLKEQVACKTLLTLYADIHAAAYRDQTDLPEGFFRTRLTTLASVVPGTGLKDGFGMDSNYSISFGRFLERNNMPEGNKTDDFLSLLYSETENFDKPLSMGFKGSPNVGSVVLNGIQDTPLFKAFETAFGPEDRIFIISSIFGGTGAAGFPLLLKTFRMHSNAMIREAKIGGLTVMPYFKLSDPDAGNAIKSDIDSRNFLTKTKSALSYYIRNITDLNALYYIADPYEQTKVYKNDEQEQADAAHLIELLGAFSVTHFAGHTFTDRTQQVFRYGLKKNEPEIHFKNIGDETARDIALPLTALAIFRQLHKDIVEKKNLPFRKTSKFDDRFFNDPFFSNLLEVFLKDHFEPWLNELADNQRGFNPFNDRARKNFSSWIKEFKIGGKVLPGLVHKPFDHSDLYVNMAKKEKAHKHRNEVNKKTQYLAMAYQAIKTTIEDNISF